MARDSVVKIKNRSRDYYCTLDHVICNLVPRVLSFPPSTGRGEGRGTGRGAVFLARFVLIIRAPSPSPFSNHHAG